MSMDYLQQGFIDAVWPQAVDLLGNEIIHGAWSDAHEQGFDLHVSETSLDMSALPRFTLSAGQLKLRFPGTGSYRFKTHVVKPLPGPIPDVGTTVTAGLSAEMTIDNVDQPVVSVGVDLDSGPVGDIADWFTRWEGDLKTRIKQGFGAHLGFFSTARYDTSVAVAVPSPELVYGHTGLEPRKAIDVVLVSDGFTATNMGQFRAVVEAFKTQMTTPASSRGNEPYYSFRSAIRIWKMEVPAAVPGHLSHRVVTGYDDVPSGSRKTALANLARLGQIGLKAESVDADVVVFMSDRATFGGDARAMAMGSVVMLPVSGGSAADDASVLLHEIGHTVLGGLADEYIEDVGLPHDALSSLRPTPDAGTAAGARVEGEAILFADKDFRGPHKHVFAAEGRLDFADRTSSIAVLSGAWQLYRDGDFRQPYQAILGPGLYPNVAALDVAHDTVSALRPSGAAPTVPGAPIQGQALLFEHTGLRGAHKHVFGPEPRLDFADRTSSIAVLSGAWRGYQDVDFGEPYSSVLGRGLYRDLAPTYHGKEPQAPNVTAEKPGADGATPRKWARWTQGPSTRPSWDRFPIETFQGARYHGAGLWRPAEDCKMRTTRQDMPFCAVCREALTLGMRKILGGDVFLVEYGYPARDETRRAQVGPADGAGKLVYRLRVPESGTIQVKGKLVAGTLPEPWTIVATFSGSGSMTAKGQEWAFTGRLGDVLRLTISSGCPFVPWNPLPTLSLELRCDLPLRDVPQAAPSVPVGLKASLSTAGPGKPFITRLSASSLDTNADDIRFQFEIEDQAGALTGQVDAQSDWRGWTQASPTVTGIVDRALGAGAYKVRARALDATGRSSAWSEVRGFEVPQPLDTRR